MKNRSKVLILLLVILLGSFLTYFLFSTSSEGDTFSPILEGDKLTSYEKTCIEMNISQAVNNPSSLNGQKVKVSGQIARINEFLQFDKNRTYIELIIPNYTPTFYVIISYADVTSFKVGDNITIYGECEYPVRTTITPELVNKDLLKINAVRIESVSNNNI